MGSANRMSKSNYIAIDSCHNAITNANICCSSYFNQFFKIHAQEPSIVISLISVCPSWAQAACASQMFCDKIKNNWSLKLESNITIKICLNGSNVWQNICFPHLWPKWFPFTRERKSHTSSLSSRSPFSSGDSDLVESINFLRKPSSVKKKWK